MHKDLEEILKIAQIVSNKRCNKNDTLLLLKKVCCNTADYSRKLKYEEFELKEKELVNSFSCYVGTIWDKCKKNKCDECAIANWCNKYRNDKQREELKKIGYTYADFFCGAGGLSLGFHKAGFKMSLANDIQDCCIDTISFNHPEVPEKNIVVGDINEVLENIKKLSRYKDVDVVIGGPPCQGFSTANRQRIIDDPRNHLYKSFVETIKIISPKFFVMENVRGMLGVKGDIIKDFNNIGYSATAYILNAKDFGIPQNRKRVIFIGNRIEIDNERIFKDIFGKGEGFSEVSLSDAIDDLPVLSAKRKPNQTEIEDESSGYTFAEYRSNNQSEYVKRINKGIKDFLLYNHKARYNNDRDIKIFSILNPGENSLDPKISDIMPYKRRNNIFKDKYYKLESDQVCKTITAHMKYDCNMYIHPNQARGLTPREAARIQSYPDSYYFRGAYTKTYMQVGNSVPPLLGEIIAESIKNVLMEVDNGSL